MKVYIRQDSTRQFANVNFFTAYDGFKNMGWDVRGFDRDTNFDDLERDNVVVGYIGDIHKALTKLGLDIPVEVNYPEELQEFLGRKIWRSKIDYIASHPELWNVFVKPIYRSKKFTGRVIKSTKDLIGCGDEFENTDIWCSEVVEFVTEWRCFVRYGKVIDVRKYAGDWRVSYDRHIITATIDRYHSAPKAYAADFGVTQDGRTLLVEVNNGYSLGCYGLLYLDYAKFLSAKWAEMTGSIDYCVDF